MDRRLVSLLAGPVLAALLVAWFCGGNGDPVPENPNPGPSSSPSSRPPPIDPEVDANDAMLRYQSAFAAASSSALSSALDDLADLSQSYDLAADMSEAGLYAGLVGHLGLCLNSTAADPRCTAPVQARIAMALGAAAHNHPAVSARIADDGAVPVLAGLVRSGVRAGVHRALQALASLFRANPASACEFAAGGRGEYDGAAAVALLQAAAAEHPLRALRVVEQLLDVQADGVPLPCDWQGVADVALQVGCGRRGHDDDDTKSAVVAVADAIMRRCAAGLVAPALESRSLDGRGSE